MSAMNPENFRRNLVARKAGALRETRGPSEARAGGGLARLRQDRTGDTDPRRKMQAFRGRAHLSRAGTVFAVPRDHVHAIKKP